jgi:xanthine dehydrogenase accessory factor
MDERHCVIVCGVNELASAVARRLRLADFAVAMHEACPPRVLRRKMAFSDAWYDGAAALDGVEARRADSNADFIAGLRSGSFIPLLSHPLQDVVGRWPWDVVVDVRGDAGPRQLSGTAELTVAVGRGAVAGRDCDLVIETAGPDPGAVLREGSAHGGIELDVRAAELVRVPVGGVFRARRMIGERVPAGAMLGAIDVTPVTVARAGRIRGLQRSPWSVKPGEAVAELIADDGGPVSGSARLHREIARAVAFAIDVELKWPAMRFENLRWS